MSETRKKWRVTWRSSVMPAPAFWYFDTLDSADEAAETIKRRGGVAAVSSADMEPMLYRCDVGSGDWPSESSEPCRGIWTC